MDGYIKIGITSGDSPSNVQKRMKELDSTGVPRAFECEYAAVVNNYLQVEKALHTAFGGFRVRDSSEFFQEISPHRVMAVLKLLEVRNVTPDIYNVADKEGFDKERPPKGQRFSFSLVDIPVGAKLSWSGDQKVQCEVADTQDEVVHEGTNYSLRGCVRKT